MTKIDKILKKIDDIIENISITELDMRILLDEYEKILNEIASETSYEIERLIIDNEIKKYDVFDLHTNGTSSNETEEVLAA